MTDKKLQDYLWDPGAEPAPDVAALERRLSELRFDPGARPLVLPKRAVRSPLRRPLVALAIAAALLLVTGAGLWTWRWSWPEGRAWTVRSASHDASLEVGRGMTLPAGDQAIANIGRIGTMRIAGGTAFELRATRGARHRLRMSEGQLHVRVWAPPSSVVVETPAGEVIDMGCEFVLTVTGGTSVVRVLSGWVQLENGIDEVRIPAGASSEMNSAQPPAIPVFDDAVTGFREAVQRAGQGDAAAIGQMLQLARARDVYTLLTFADRHPDLAPQVLPRASDLFPPPGDVTVGRVLRGDREALEVWRHALPLPALKSDWWKNWRDALPLWMSVR